MPSEQRVKAPSVDGEDGAPEVDALFADVAPDAPGAAVGIYRDGGPILVRCYGLADVEAARPITGQTPLHVASLAKQFTALATLLLSSEGSLDLDADIRDHLPFVPDFGDTITARHLLLHTSGLRNQWKLLMLGGQGMEGRITQQQIVNLVSRQEALNFPPGHEFAYSNTGYTLLAELVSVVTGQSLREFTTERIFAPLDMRQTWFHDDVTEIVPGRAHSYTRRPDASNPEGARWARGLLNYDTVGATNLITTVQDLAHWAANFSEPVVGDRLLLEQLCTSGRLDDGTPINYAFGLERGEIDGRAAVSHTGSDAAFRSIFVRFPEHDLAVSILANTELALQPRVRALADIYLPAAAPRVTPAPEQDSAADLSRFVGTYVPDHGISCRIEHQEGMLTHQWGSRAPQALTARVDGTLDFGTP